MSNGADNDSAIITIDHKGIILSANQGVKHILGYEKPASIIGENVSIIVPPPFDKHHGEYVSKFLVSGESSFLGKTRKIVALRADGYLVPVNLRHINFV